jgi:hypothetical protein
MSSIAGKGHTYGAQPVQVAARQSTAAVRSAINPSLCCCFCRKRRVLRGTEETVFVLMVKRTYPRRGNHRFYMVTSAPTVVMLRQNKTHWITAIGR